ncbi:MAG: hypothetical protein HYT63_02595 [Candidatus Yanofskybacteria bacterium]|nr:hypothetical protein [Candidatus Yanofskybacteria bacterium]
MLGVILTTISSFFSEAFSVIGKKAVEKKEESIFTMGFLLFFWGAILFLGIILWKTSFDFSMASLPTFIPRIFIEIVLISIVLKATVIADRSTFSFIRTATLPLLLVVDLFMGYSVSPMQIIGMGIIVFALVILFRRKSINKKGLKLAVWSAILPVPTIALFKYNITHYNSVEAEELLISLSLLFYFFFMAKRLAGENPIRLLVKPLFFKQSLSEGLAMIFNSFAYLFASASVITSAKRSSAILWAVLSGNKIFAEKNFVLKLMVFVLMTIGTILLVF